MTMTSSSAATSRASLARARSSAIHQVNDGQTIKRDRRPGAVVAARMLSRSAGGGVAFGVLFETDPGYGVRASSRAARLARVMWTVVAGPDSDRGRSDDRVSSMGFPGGHNADDRTAPSIEAVGACQSTSFSWLEVGNQDAGARISRLLTRPVSSGPRLS